MISKQINKAHYPSRHSDVSLAGFVDADDKIKLSSKFFFFIYALKSVRMFTVKLLVKYLAS